MEHVKGWEQVKILTNVFISPLAKRSILSGVYEAYATIQVSGKTAGGGDEESIGVYKGV